jgi:hypothetical protein
METAPLKRRWTSTTLHGTTSQKTVFIVLADVTTWNFTSLNLRESYSALQHFRLQFCECTSSVDSCRCRVWKEACRSVIVPQVTGEGVTCSDTDVQPYWRQSGCKDRCLRVVLSRRSVFLTDWISPHSVALAQFQAHAKFFRLLKISKQHYQWW